MNGCNGEVAPGEVIVSTEALGLSPGTPLLALASFNAASGRCLTCRFDAYHVFLPEAEGRTRIRHHLGGRPVDLDLGPGDMVMTPKGVEAGFEWDTPLRATGLWIDADGIRDFARVEMGVAVDGSDFEGAVVLNDPEIADAIHAIRQAMLTSGAGQNLIFDSLARVFLAVLVRRHGRLSDPDAAAFGDGRMEALRAHVDARLHASPHVADMADAVGMSSSAFGRALRAATGLTPMAFLREARIERAKSMLRGQATLGEIAVRCGFADQAHFSRSFKTATGRTPRAWRMAERSGDQQDATTGDVAASVSGRTVGRPADDAAQSASC